MDTLDVKKSLILLVTMIMLFACAVTPSAAASTQADNITSAATVTVSSGNAATLTDNDTSTFEGGESFAVSAISSEPIYGIYLKWNDATADAEISCNGDKVKCGNGFLHEYISVDGVTSFTLSWSENATLAEIALFGQGDVPDFVQRWQPPCDKADILLMPTHADDEDLYFGGTMPYYAGELGYTVQVAYMTYHEKERWHELLDGLWTAGTRNYPVISDKFEDKYCASYEAAKKKYSEKEVLSYFTEVIRRFKPEVVIGHDLNGEYGHGAHMLSAHVLCNAITAAADDAYDPMTAEKYGTWQVKKLYLHLYEKNSVVMDWNIALETFGGKTAYEVACDAFKCHKSQLKYFSMSCKGKYGCAYFGLYSSTVGEDIEKKDFLENIPETALTTYVEPMFNDTCEQTTEELSTEKNTDAPTSYIEVIAPTGDVTDLVRDRNLIPIVITAVLCSAFAVLTIIILLHKDNESMRKR